MADPTTGVSLLIIEDDPGYQEFYRFVLAEYELTICSSVEQALAEVRRKRFDLMLSDINLWGMTGLEFLNIMGRNGVSKSIPIIVCSSQADAVTRQSALERGAGRFIAKPFECDALRQAVQVMLKTRTG